ncbi:MAG: ABC transporter ATP-binding protein [Rhodospirillales bacterium]|nr:ABC transporter ATP-binding protein [Rhodospirillales bacterium]
MLECNNLSVFYGQHHALDQVSINIKAQEIVVILGANGAGKSSLLKAIAGIIPSAEGSQVYVDGEDITRLPTHDIVKRGIALVPEGRGIFGDLTVLENLMLGAFLERASGSGSDNLDRVFSLFPKLSERKTQIARTMSGGEQQMVAIARALMSAPTILMLDEPSLGLSPILCSELFKTLEQIRKTGVGILLVEQNAKQSLAIADRGYLLEIGRIIGEDEAELLRNDPSVQKAYLGGAASRVSSSSAKIEKSIDPPTIATSSDKHIIIPSGLGQRSIETSQIISDDIDKIINHAAESQYEYLGSKMLGRKTQPNASNELNSILSSMEQSARNARIATSQKTQLETEIHQSHDQVKPVIEIYKKPKIEVYRRKKTKVGEKMVKLN